MNTIAIIYQRKKRRQVRVQKTLTFFIKLFCAIVIAWVPIILFYEIPCKLGEQFNIDWEIVRIAQRAEQKVAMKNRTGIVSVNILIHELEEVKEFYANI